MNKKVILIVRHGCQMCEVLEYELIHNEKFEVITFTDTHHPDVFQEFLQRFKINRFPAIQVDDGKDFITIHGDPDFVEPVSGAGSSMSKALFYFENTINKQISRLKELLKD
jgi:hypothetical protein